MKSFSPRYILDLCRRILFLAFFAQVFTIDAMGDTKVIVDGIKYNLVSETKTASVIANNYSGDVVIPSSFTSDGVEYSVTSIANQAFVDCSALTSITIPNSVSYISTTAFWSCSSLTSIIVAEDNPYYDSRNNSNAIIKTSSNILLVGCKNTVIPNSVTGIGNGAFYRCTGLTFITIPESVTGIGSNAFYGCSGLTSLSIPSGQRVISFGTFHGCSSLTSVTIPESVTSIGGYAFYDCSGLTSITMPESVISIGSSAFYGCSGLTSVTIPGNVTSIGDYAFYYCSGLTSVIIPNSVTNIGTNVFSYCSGLDSLIVAEDNPNYDSRNNSNAIIETSSNTLIAGCQNTVIPNSVTSIGKSAFERCLGLTSVSIPENVTSIGSAAFLDCSNLMSVAIPNSVTSISDYAFSGCRALETIYTFATKPPSLSSTSFRYYISNTPTLYVRSGCKEAYAGAQYWNQFDIVELIYVESVKINEPKYDLIVGESKSIDIKVLPSTATSQDLYWKIENPEIAVIDNGVVTGIKTGTTVITATTTDGTNLSASCTVNVTNPVVALTLDRISAELMVGQQITLQATCTPSNADNINVSWSSNNEDIASVNNGVVIAKGLGDAIITASSVNGIEATCKITVVPTPVTSLSLNTTSVDLVKDATYQLTCSITPEDATNKGLVWTSLNSGVASVNESGLVTAMSTGTTTIIVSSASNSEITASCTFNVTTPVTAIKLDHGVLEMFVEDAIQLKATCMPSDADNANVVWSTTNGEIAIVSQAGYITAKNEGDVTIAATTTDGTNLSASCWIHVKRHKQAIIWNQEVLTCQEGGEMIVLEAGSSSGLPVMFSSSVPDVLSIFDLGDVVYANPIKEGKTMVSAYQQGNYKYEPAEAKREIEVIGKPMGGSRTLVAYYSQSALMDGIVAELTNQIASSYTQVYTQKIEPSNARIDMANHDVAIRDSVMNVISLYPDDAVSYPEIKPLNVAVGDYDDIILVYPIWNMSMAAPMQTFCFQNRDILESKSVAYIEYDLFDEAGTSSNAQVLRLCPSNIADKKDLIKEWLDNSVATGILQFRHDKQESRDGIYDLQGRKLHEVPSHGIFMIEGKKIAK